MPRSCGLSMRGASMRARRRATRHHILHRSSRCDLAWYPIAGAVFCEFGKSGGARLSHCHAQRSVPSRGVACGIAPPSITPARMIVRASRRPSCVCACACVCVCGLSTRADTWCDLMLAGHRACVRVRAVSQPLRNAAEAKPGNALLLRPGMASHCAQKGRCNPAIEMLQTQSPAGHAPLRRGMASHCAC